jgi:hypothetical protein
MLGPSSAPRVEEGPLVSARRTAADEVADAGRPVIKSEEQMRWALISILAVSVVAVTAPAEARSSSCANAVRRLDAAPLHSRAAIEQLGRAKAALNEGSQRDCLAHVQQAQRDERRYAGQLRNGYSGSSTPPSRYRRAYPEDHSADELNRRELQRYDLR